MRGIALCGLLLVGACTCGGIGPTPDDGGGDDGGVGDDGGAPPGHDAGPSTPDDMVHVAAGPFTMGCDDCGESDEAPAHEVTLAAFDIDVTEVTQAAYLSCVDDGDCTAPAANFDPDNRGAYPVVNVSWQQASEYCAARGRRLPTEAEWEKAARGVDARLYPWGDDDADCALANTSSCGGDAAPAGSLPNGASPYGALDMAGNVWEWTADWYGERAYDEHDAPDPAGPQAGEYRVYRGGSAGNDAELARTTNRASTYNPDVGGSGLGFRCAR